MDNRLSNALLVANAAGLTDADLANAVEAVTDAHRQRVASPGLVAMTHDGLPGHFDMWVDPEAVEIYERSGWAIKPDDVPDEPNDEEPAEVDEAADTEETSA